MTDREMLELAAMAYGIEHPCYMEIYHNKGINRGPTMSLWNPRDDNGDAFMLMAKLNINVFYRENINGAFVIADHCDIECCAESLDGPHEDYATRRAIVRAAAAYQLAKGEPS